MQEAVTQEGCVFCDIVGGKGTRKIYEDDTVVAFHDIHPAAKLHLQVIPKAHIESTAYLRNSQPDAELVAAMHEVGKKLVNELAAGRETKFGFHDPPFLSVPHLHMHCFALPHTNPLRALKFIPSNRVRTGFVTVDQVLERMRQRPRYDESQ